MTAGEADLPSRLGRYELITRIGQGGMADVQLALQRGPMGFEKLVVVKLVHAKLASEKAFVDMLLDEARVAALLKHPNVVDIYDLGEVEGRYFIAMEYLEGEPLLAVLRAGRDGQRLDVNSTARLVADTAEGLEAAHELRSMGGEPLELVHHDVSLGNIVVLYNGQVKLVDFGVAKATQSASTRSKVQGKFSYMAPEKLRGSQGDRRSDIFSLGCVLWEALTLRRLFKGGTDDETMQQVLEAEIPLPSQVNGDVSPAYDAIVMRALERDEARRYPTAKELADDLEEVLRKEGFARKNDSIAKYMQVTFKSHIDARKKLLQEVSSKGGASAAVLEAAFSPAPVVIVASAGGDRGEFSIKFRRSSVEMNATGALAAIDAIGTPPEALVSPASHDEAVLTLAPVHPEGAEDLDDDEDDERERLDTPTGSAPLETFSTWRDPGEVIAVASPTAAVAGAAVVAPRNRRRLYLVGASLACSIVAIVIIMATTRPATPKISVRPGVEPAPLAGSGRFGSNALAVPDRGSASEPVGAGSAIGGAAIGSDAIGSDAIGSDAIVAPGSDALPSDLTAGSALAEPGMGSDIDMADGGVAHRSPSAKKAERTPAEINHQLGRQAFAQGDFQSALAHLRRAQQANADYAPVWRDLGFVYERIGELPQARIAFVRYIQLVPNASDIATVRGKLEKLGK